MVGFKLRFVQHMANIFHDFIILNMTNRLFIFFVAYKLVRINIYVYFKGFNLYRNMKT